MLLLISAFVFVLILAVVAFMAVQYKNTAMKKNGEDTAMEGKSPVDKTTEMGKKTPAPVTAAPTVDFTAWTMKNTAVTTPASPTVYYFKSSYSLQDAQTLATKLDANGTIKKDNSSVIAYTGTADKKDLSLLLFNTVNGSFSFASTKGVDMKLANGSTVKSDQLYQVLKSLNVYDPSMKMTASYKKKAQPGVTFYELHRDWQATGYPILNAVGLLNVPEQQSLSTLALSSKLSTTLPSEDIYGTTDGKDGLARQNDFNTVTMAFNDTTGALTELRSNVRLIQSTGQQSSVLTYEEAVNKLKNGQSDFILTTPSGSGDAPWTKIYPENMAHSKNAIVTEAILAYLEQPPAVVQTQMTPSYIFKGYADLTSGYRVDFIASVSTAPSGDHAQAVSFTLAKNAYAAVDTPDTDKGQKQSTFDGSNPSLSTGSPSTSGSSGSPPSGSSTSTADPSGVCRPSSVDLSPIYQIPAGTGLKYGWANWRLWDGKISHDNKNGFWYYIPDAGVTDSITQQNLDAIIQQLQTGTGAAPAAAVTTAATTPAAETGTGDDTTQKQGTFQITNAPITGTAADITTQELVIRKQQKIIRDILNIAEDCPIRLTGPSPSLFIYGHEGQQVTVRQSAQMTYVDPATDKGSWNVTMHTSGLTVNGYERPYIYYEYAPVAFTKPSLGWVVKKSNLDGFVANIASQLGLNAAEASRTRAELSHAISSVHGETLFIGLVDQKELNAQLPLSFSTTPDAVTRIHFYVTAAHGETPHAPVLAPVTRKAYTVLEIGSYGK